MSRFPCPDVGARENRRCSRPDRRSRNGREGGMDRGNPDVATRLCGEASRLRRPMSVQAVRCVELFVLWKSYKYFSALGKVRSEVSRE